MLHLSLLVQPTELLGPTVASSPLAGCCFCCNFGAWTRTWPSWGRQRAVPGLALPSPCPLQWQAGESVRSCSPQRLRCPVMIMRCGAWPMSGSRGTVDVEVAHFTCCVAADRCKGSSVLSLFREELSKASVPLSLSPATGKKALTASGRGGPSGSRLLPVRHSAVVINPRLQQTSGG